MTTKELKVGSKIQWQNYLGIWQSGRVEKIHGDYNVIVRRPPPEDSEGLPNNETIFLDTRVGFRLNK